jgi:hypothetical protein
MDSLATAPVADVLARLFDEAQATESPLEERFAEVAADDEALPFGDHRGNEMSVRTA